MGEVYRPRDTKLNRSVALKVLPERFALDPDRLARFKREAQVLASLNHPNIATIYGFEDSQGVQGLVLELVEGGVRCPGKSFLQRRGPIEHDGEWFRSGAAWCGKEKKALAVRRKIPSRQKRWRRSEQPSRRPGPESPARVDVDGHDLRPGGVEQLLTVGAPTGIGAC
jgi:Protein kinase domain